MAASVRAVATAAETDGTVTVTKPSGTASGDVLVAFCMGYSPTVGDMTAPAGFTERLGDLGGGSTVQGGKVFTKVAGGSEPASYDFVNSVGAYDYFAVILFAVQGADTTTNDGMDGSALTDATSGTSTAVAPSISPASSDALLLCGVVGFSNNPQARTTTPPSGMTERADFMRPDEYDTYSAASLALSASGATGTKTFTFSESSAAANGYHAFSIGIKSSGAAAVSPPIRRRRPQLTYR